MRVVPLSPLDTHSLRRRVLYGHWAEADVHYPEDDLVGAFHLGLTEDDGAHLLAAASWYPMPCPAAPGRLAYRLRGMGVEVDARGQGLGRLLFQAGVAQVRSRGGDLLWANARDSVVGFYARLGMRIVGEGFTAAGGLPHHVVLKEL